MNQLARVAVGLLLLASCREAVLSGPQAQPRNLLLISIDTLRPDHLGAYGYGRPTSPRLDALAARGVLFEDVSAPSPWTLPSHASMLTGLYPSRHGLRSHAQRLADGVVTLAERLAEQGFTTAAVVNAPSLSRPYGLARGFERFFQVRYQEGRAAPSGVGGFARNWLKNYDGSRPFFLFLHFFDVHSDYVSLPQYEQGFVLPYAGKADGTTKQLLAVTRGELSLDEADARHLIDLYDAGIRQMDDVIAGLLDFLEARGLLESTLIVVTSDHGEEFLEHGNVLHARAHYQELLRVPLILSGPGVPSGLRIAEQAALVDLMPTLLSLLEVPVPPSLDGVDLSKLWRQAGSAPPVPRLLFAEADATNARPDVKRAVREGRYTLHLDLLTGETQLFDLVEDPGETRDISHREPDVAARLRGELERFMRVDVKGPPVAGLSPQQTQQLRSLGYLQ